MRTVLDTLYLRRPRLNYVSPPVCPVVISASGSSSSAEELFPVAAPIGESFCSVGSKFIRLVSIDQAICHSLYRESAPDTFTIVYECIPRRSAVVCRAGCYRVGAIVNGAETLGNPVCVVGDVPVIISLPAADAWNLHRAETVDGEYSVEVAAFGADIFETCVAGNYRLTSITLDGESRLSDNISPPNCGEPGPPPPPPVVQTPCPVYSNIGFDQNPCPEGVDRNATTIAQDEDGFSMNSGFGFLAPGFWGSAINQADADDIARALLAKKVEGILDLVDCTPFPCDNPVNVENLGVWPITIQRSYCPRFQIGCEILDCCICGYDCPNCACCGGPCDGPCAPGCFKPASIEPVDLCPAGVTVVEPLEDGGPGAYFASAFVDTLTQVFCEDTSTFPCAVCEGECGNSFARLFLGPVTLCNNSGGVYRLRIDIGVEGTLCKSDGCNLYSAVTARVNVNGPSGHVIEVNQGIADAVWQSEPCGLDFNRNFSENLVFEFDLPEGANTVFIRLITTEAVNIAWQVALSPLVPPP